MTTRLDDLDAAVRAAGIAITGLTGSGARCRLCDDDAARLSPADQAAAAKIIAAWDWTPVKDPKGVAAIGALLDQADGTAKGKAAIAAMQRRMLVDWIRANPEDAKAIAKAAGVDFEPRQ